MFSSVAGPVSSLLLESQFHQVDEQIIPTSTRLIIPESRVTLTKGKSFLDHDGTMTPPLVDRVPSIVWAF